MKFHFLCLIVLFLSFGAHAQDERYFRKLFSGELVNKKDNNPYNKVHFNYSSPYYLVDINGDAEKESLAFVKKDGSDFFEIYDGRNGLLFSHRLDNHGPGSEIFKIEVKKLSSKTNVILLHYFEGYTNYIDYQGTARIYAVTIDNKDLKTLKALKGAIIFDETKLLKGHYHQRNYRAYLEDLDDNGIMELVVKYRNISTVFKYSNQFKWSSYY